jgi:hypothetical protein
VITNADVDTQYYDPRVWIREGEKTLVTRVKEACADLGNVGTYQRYPEHIFANVEASSSTDRL